MTGRLAAMIGLLVCLAPASAYAQTNIDQGKTPAQIFENDCAVCHKAVRGLAGGKNSAALADFLREHYTASREQAAALAAYVLGGGRGQKPAAERAKATEKPQTRPAAESPAAAAKSQRPAADEAKTDDGAADDSDAAKQGRRPAAGRQIKRPAMPAAARGRGKEPETPSAAVPGREPAIAREPAAVREPATPRVPATAAVEPNPAYAPRSEAGSMPTAATPAEPPPGDSTPVPRDNIPD